MSDKKLFAVTGNPILHSKSPFIYNCLFSRYQVNAVYTRIAADSADEAMFIFNQVGFSGMNITAPFKVDFLKFLDQIDESGKVIESVNTIVKDSNKLKGYNTDIYGVIESFNKRKIKISGQKIVILGAGGAARAAAYGLIKKDARVTIVNRTVEKARKIAEKFGCAYAGIEQLRDLIKFSAILVSTLPAGVNVVKDNWLKNNHIIFDANYKSSQLTEKASHKGYTVIKGEEWLLNQALLAFKYYTGETPDETAIKNLSNFEISLQKPKNISLIGFMGTGKSLIGKELAKKLNWTFVDIDDLIEKRKRKTIPEIFSDEGEDSFRKIESQILREIIGKSHLVLSCGGGIVLKNENRIRLKDNSICVWLFSIPETSIKRIKKGSRPLLETENPLTMAHKIFTKRKGLYAETADIVVNSEDKSAKNVANKIYEEISQTFGYQR
ncbi:MAG: NAD(P)-binding domain-containing protein [Candidatus Marinimicrobia bacterium]|nr:NAD(P)-binding domain-containing protein [Candidatus Neomarinimicrobiota bacterium]